MALFHGNVLSEGGGGDSVKVYLPNKTNKDRRIRETRPFTLKLARRSMDPYHGTIDQLQESVISREDRKTAVWLPFAEISIDGSQLSYISKTREDRQLRGWCDFTSIGRQEADIIRREDREITSWGHFG